MYVAEKYGQTHDPALEWAVLRQQLAEARTGWTLDYIDSMTWRDIEETLAYLDGVAKARAK